jgi:hypothetical protein
MSDPIPWADGPPPVPVASVWTPPTGIWDLVLLGPWFAVWLHWLGKRSMPCLGGCCPTARHGKPVRWSAYAPAALAEYETVERRKVKTWKPIVLPIGLECAHEVGAQLGNYPGPGLRLTRKSGQRAWTWAIIPITRQLAGVPKVFDPRPTLYRLWGVRPPDQAELPAPAND